MLEIQSICQVLTHHISFVRSLPIPNGIFYTHGTKFPVDLCCLQNANCTVGSSIDITHIRVAIAY